MCGRYALSLLPAELVEEFELTVDRTPGILPVDWNIAPTRDIYIIKNNLELHNQLLCLTPHNKNHHKDRCQL